MKTGSFSAELRATLNERAAVVQILVIAMATTVVRALPCIPKQG